VRDAGEPARRRAHVGVGGRPDVNRMRVLLLATLVPLLVVVAVLVLAALHSSG
jgi:hypothetical protein